jgi:hypothetical protein
MVSWPLANTHRAFGRNDDRPRFDVDETGAVLQVPGLCSLHRIQALRETMEAIEPPYCEDMFMWGFDTLACLIMRKAGWKTRLVMGKDNKIAHDEPHSGVTLNPEMRQHREHSRRVLRRKIFDLCLEDVPGVL